MSDELKPCPFCGKAAETNQNHPLSGTTSDYYGCNDCRVYQDTVDGWNTRAEPAPGPAPLVWSSERPTTAGIYLVLHDSGIVTSLQRIEGDPPLTHRVFDGKRFAGPIVVEEPTP